MVFLVDDVIPGLFAFFEFFPALKLRDDRVCLIVLVGGFFRRSGNDQRGTGFVDQDRVNLVYDRVIMSVLHTSREIELHVVAQVIETKLVVRAVGNVGVISILPLKVIHVILDTANRQAQEAINLAHPFRVARSQVIVHRDHVDATTGQRIEVSGQRGHQRFAFAGAHLGNLALMQNDSADQLHVKVAHARRAHARLAHHGKGFR